MSYSVNFSSRDFSVPVLLNGRIKPQSLSWSAFGGPERLFCAWMVLFRTCSERQGFCAALCAFQMRKPRRSGGALYRGSRCFLKTPGLRSQSMTCSTRSRSPTPSSHRITAWLTSTRRIMRSRGYPRLNMGSKRPSSTEPTWMMILPRSSGIPSFPSTSSLSQFFLPGTDRVRIASRLSPVRGGLTRWAGSFMKTRMVFMPTMALVRVRRSSGIPIIGIQPKSSRRGHPATSSMPGS